MIAPTKSRLGMAAALGVVVALSAFVVSSVSVGVESRIEPADHSDALNLPTPEPMSTLQAAPKGEKERKRAIYSIIRELRFSENLQNEGDARLTLTANKSLMAYGWLLDDKQEVESGNTGARMEVPAKEQFLAPKTTRVRWAHQDYMFYLESEITTDSANKFVDMDNSVVSYDGKYMYRYSMDQRAGTMLVGGSTTEASIISALTLSTNGNTTFSELLKAPGTVYEGVQTIGGNTCRKVSLAKGGGTIEIWFSPADGYRAKRMVYTRKPQPGGYGAYVVKEASGFKRYGHTWFPTGGYDVWYRTDESGHKDWVSCDRWALISYNPAVSDELFSLAFPKGANVVDMTASDSTVRHYVAGEDSGDAPTPSDGTSK